MPIWREDKELSKYSRYKAKMDLMKIGQVVSMLAGVLLRGAALARIRLRVCVGFCMHFQTARVVSCHGHDSYDHAIISSDGNKDWLCNGLLGWIIYIFSV